MTVKTLKVRGYSRRSSTEINETEAATTNALWDAVCIRAVEQALAEDFTGSVK